MIAEQDVDVARTACPSSIASENNIIGQAARFYFFSNINTVTTGLIGKYYKFFIADFIYIKNIFLQKADINRQFFYYCNKAGIITNLLLVSETVHCLCTLFMYIN